MWSSLSQIGRTVLSIAGVVLVWWLIASSGLVNRDLFPTPAMVWEAAYELYEEGALQSDLKVSLARAAVGFLIGSLAGILVGLLTART